MAPNGWALKAEFSGPEKFSPEEELAAFQKAVSEKPSGILLSAARVELFKDAIDGAVCAGHSRDLHRFDAPNSKRVTFIGTDNYRAGMESGKRMGDLLRARDAS